MALVAVAAGQPLETVLMWPRSLASNSSCIGVIGERVPLKPGLPAAAEPVSGQPQPATAHSEQSPAPSFLRPTPSSTDSIYWQITLTVRHEVPTMFSSLVSQS